MRSSFLIQEIDRYENMAKTATCSEYRYKWTNWQGWLVGEAFIEEIRLLRHDKSVTPARKSELLREMKNFFIYVHRTWGDAEAKEWINGGTWHRIGTAFFARMAFLAHKKGQHRTNMKRMPPDIEDRWKAFCEAFRL
jgi:hypothetical protein